MKKFACLMLCISLLLTFCFPQISFATDNILHEVTINGENFIVKEEQNNSNQRIVTVENNSSIIKAIYNKETNKIEILKKVKDIKKINDDIEMLQQPKTDEVKFFEHISFIDLSPKPILVEPRFVYEDTYNSNYFSEYTYRSTKWSHTESVFKLTIPKDTFTTPPVSMDVIKEECWDFKSDLKEADDYAESAMLALLGFVPGVGQAASICVIIDSLSFDDLSESDFISAAIAAVELIPGLGTIVSLADFGANAALSGAKLYNTRQHFARVKDYYR